MSTDDLPPHTPVWRVGYNQTIHLDRHCRAIKRAETIPDEKTLGVFPETYNRCSECFPNRPPSVHLDIQVGDEVVETIRLEEGDVFDGAYYAHDYAICVAAINPRPES